MKLLYHNGLPAHTINTMDAVDLQAGNNDKRGGTIIVFHLVFSAEQERSFCTAHKICPTSPFGPKLLSHDISLSVVVANAAYVTNGKLVSSPGELLTGSSGLIELP